MVPVIQRVLREIAPDVPVVHFRTQQQQIALGFATEHLMARTSIFFGAVALLLACLGLYGMLSYTVTRRTSEIAVRMAFGARRNAVVWLVLREVALLLLIGSVLGVAGAFALTRTIATLLYGLGPNDALTLIGAVIALVTVGALAGYLPARRAARIEPWTALRYD
jgi:ABC-type antimicrobial peptide transport system permease subunit